MRVTTKGQVTIPQTVRNFLGIRPNSEVDFVVEDRKVMLVKTEKIQKKSRFQKVVGILKNGKTTDQMMEFTRD
ncbi:MAG: AbrB/MazE/SpoVT family DNA-binding domain-containing protein [Spirochaetia bacterium]|nr:AbrB/MazE/SpoVT family DNA-binding domain-containing protein [Spirochaetia bacterium]